MQLCHEHRTSPEIVRGRSMNDNVQITLCLLAEPSLQSLGWLFLIAACSTFRRCPLLYLGMIDHKLLPGSPAVIKPLVRSFFTSLLNGGCMKSRYGYGVLHCSPRTQHHHLPDHNNVRSSETPGIIRARVWKLADQ